MVHRTVLGSMERFIGGLIEHFGGDFPLWLAPVQAIVLPITDAHAAYAQEVVAEMASVGMRVELDERNEKVNLKIREAIGRKIPYMLIVGDREVTSRTLAVRTRKDGDVGTRALSDFVKETQTQIQKRI